MSLPELVLLRGLHRKRCCIAGPSGRPILGAPQAEEGQAEEQGNRELMKTLQILELLYNSFDIYS